MTGMKEGAGEDPFADDADGTDSATTDTTESTMTETTTETAESSEETRKYPYVIERDGVSDGRKLVRFELREQYENVDEELRIKVAERLGTAPNDQYIADVREAMVAVAARHPDEVAEVMREWGCEDL